MVNYFKPAKTKKATGQNITVRIDKLDHHGVGVAIDSKSKKSIFVTGALPGELVEAKVVEQKSKFSRAKLTKVIETSAERVAPLCKHFWQCGGCDLQHLSQAAQLAFKQEKVKTLFSRQGVSSLLSWQAPLVSMPYQYRRKARIGVQYNKRNQPIVGFRQQGSNNLISIKKCEVLPNEASSISEKLASVISKLSQKKSVGHVEVLISEHKLDSRIEPLITLVIRQLVKLGSKDRRLWVNAATQNQWHLVIDDGNLLQSIYHPFETSELGEAGEIGGDVKQASTLTYQLFDKTNIQFTPDNFIQVNGKINDLMVAQAIDWIAPTINDTVLDLFCGLGNFSIPFAKLTKSLIGVEGVDDMVQKAAQNAVNNGLTNCQFYQADLNAPWFDKEWATRHFNIVLLDPARAGAFEAVSNIVKIKPQKILYVSCEPTTLAVDAEKLISAGYQVQKISIMDMFSQTKHIETMVLFSRK